jgi:hypothetical protein
VVLRNAGTAIRWLVDSNLLTPVDRHGSSSRPGIVDLYPAKCCCSAGLACISSYTGDHHM